MGIVLEKYQTLERAIKSFGDSIAIYETLAKLQKHKNNKAMMYGLDFEEIFLGMRDSVIQRFEYSTDLLWKYLKIYLEEVLGLTLEVNSPKNIIRLCAKIGLLHEPESELAQEMIEQRNLTSHIYREEIAQMLMREVQSYAKLLETMLEKCDPKKRV